MASSRNLDSDVCLNYYDSYIDYTENVSLDIQKQLSRIKDTDVSYAALTKRIPNMVKKLLDNPSEASRQKLLSTIVNVQDMQMHKLETIQSMQDSVQNKSCELDRNYKFVGLDVCHLDSSHEETAGKEPRQGKRTKRSGKAADESKTRRGKSSDRGNQSSSGSKATTSQASKKATGGGAAAKKKKRKSTSKQTNNRRASVEDIDAILDNASVDPDEPRYCLCDQISYGEMICCDNDLCPIEWFHFACVSLTVKPKGKWFCPKCRGDRVNVMKPKAIFLKELEKYNREREEKATRNY